MIGRLADLIVDEANWLPMSMSVAMVAVAVLLTRHRGRGIVIRRGVLAAMVLFFGTTIGTMAIGHLAAVTTKLARGTLEGSTPVLFVIGAVVGLPSWWLVAHTRSLLATDAGTKTIVLHVWLFGTLAVLGLHNLPIAVPALLNIGYQLHGRRAVGWVIVGLAVAVHTVLFVGSLIFLSSGQTFEQFTGTG